MKKNRIGRKLILILARLKPLAKTPLTLFGITLLAQWLSRFEFMSQDHLAYTSGFLIAVLAGHFAAKSVVDNMWAYLRWRHPQEMKGYLETYRGQGPIVGVVERSLYFGALISNQPVFIGLWFTLKTIAQSPRWGKDSGPIQGRGIFQPFLAGTGLSLLFASGGYLITYLILKNEQSGLSQSVFIAIALLFTWLFCFILSCKAVNDLKSELRKIPAKASDPQHDSAVIEIIFDKGESS